MAGMTALVRQQWLKIFPPVQQRGIMGCTQNFLSAYKLSANSIATNAVLAADTELIIPMVQANVPYNVSMLLNITAMAAAGNAQFDFNNSTATVQTLNLVTQFYTAAGVQTNGAVTTALNTAVNGGTANVNVNAVCAGVVTFSAPGSFGMRLAQQASSATATVFDINSMLILEAIIPTVTA